jgi:hypothetical protein
MAFNQTGRVNNVIGGGIDRIESVSRHNLTQKSNISKFWMEFLSGIGDGVRLPWFYGPRWFFSKMAETISPIAENPSGSKGENRETAVILHTLFCTFRSSAGFPCHTWRSVHSWYEN